MGSQTRDVPQRPAHADIELAPLADAGGEVEILVREHHKALDEEHHRPAEPWPWFVIPVLATAVVAVSSSGVAFALVTDVPALRLGAWRLQITTAVCSPICVWQFRQLPPELKQRSLRSAWKLLFSGLCLGVHFSTWVWGIKHTSLVHAYLMVSVTPLAIAVGLLLLRKPISAGEVAGTVLGVAGAAVLTLGPKGDKGSDATLIGDAVTLIGAISIIGYLEAGQSLRTFMPLMVYAVPVTGIAGLSLMLGSFAFEHARVWPLGTQSVIGYLNGTDILPVLWLGLVPGIIGHQACFLPAHANAFLAAAAANAASGPPVVGWGPAFPLSLAAVTPGCLRYWVNQSANARRPYSWMVARVMQGLNTALKYISPLAISLSTACEPLIGSALGYVLGLTAAPSLYMYAGGTLIMSATILVTIAAHRRKARESGSVKRQLSFSNLPTSDDEEDGEALIPSRTVHERAPAGSS